MKKSISLFVAILAFTFAASAQGVITFKSITHDFGKVKEGEKAVYTYEFTNTGDAPIIISNAQPSCGCTTPTWPQQPVMKSKEDKVKAGFNAAAPGPFEKTIFVKIKGVTAPYELKISGEVVTAADFDKLNKK